MNLHVMLDRGAYMPTRAHETDAGLDLYSRDNRIIPPGGSATFDTGVHVEVPTDPLHVGFLMSKSGLNVKYGLTSTGVIDAGYTGSIVVKLYNHGGRCVEIKAGQKISQLVILPVSAPTPVLVDSLGQTERGCGGFGSTGDFAEAQEADGC